jgi:hypothetical protein
VLLGVGSSQSVEYVFGDEGPRRCWHTQGEVGQAQGMLARRKIARITLLHKAIHEKVAIPIPSYIIKPTRTSRFNHPKRYIQIRQKKRCLQIQYPGGILPVQRQRWISIYLSMVLT